MKDNSLQVIDDSLVSEIDQNKTVVKVIDTQQDS